MTDGTEAFLTQNNANPDVDYIFTNTGRDHDPILETQAKMHRSESKGPEIVVVPHEQVTVSVAYGYYSSSEKPQIVLAPAGRLNGSANCP